MKFLNGMRISVEFMLIVLIGSGGVFAQNESLSENAKIAEEEFSLTPYKPCKMPPKAPPDHLLRRKFQIDNLTFFVHKIDINGDGICDWLREGFRSGRRDQDLMLSDNLENFLFLGTANGWRRLKPLPKKYLYPTPGSEYSNKFGRGSYPIAAAIYQKGRKTPYLLGFNPPERTASGNLLFSVLGAWNAKLELLEDVDVEMRRKIINFLAKELCGNPLVTDEMMGIYEWSYEYFMIVPQNDGLCPKDDANRRLP